MSQDNGWAAVAMEWNNDALQDAEEGWGGVPLDRSDYEHDHEVQDGWPKDQVIFKNIIFLKKNCL
jgi:hypothetical protein